jgi:hypothetical protein
MCPSHNAMTASTADVQRALDASLLRACPTIGNNHAPLAPPRRAVAAGAAARTDNKLAKLARKRAKHDALFKAASCRAVNALRRALPEMGTRLVVPPGDDWRPLQGTAAELRKQHPDPLAALQRGEVPAIVLRNAVPPSELPAMAHRMLRFSQDSSADAGGFALRQPFTDRSRCALGALGTCSCNWRGSQWKGQWRLNSSLATDVDAAHAFDLLLCKEPGLPRCAGTRAADIANRSSELFRQCYFVACGPCFRPPCGAPVDRVPGSWRCRKHAYSEYGKKLLHVFGISGRRPRQATRVQSFLAESRRVQRAMRDMAERDGCRGPFCSPHDAMLHGLRQLAGPSRSVAPAREASGEEYNTGVLRNLGPRFRYPEHFDSLHSSAWPCVREGLCPREKSARDVTGFSSIGVDEFRPLATHTFSTSAILTLQAPVREAPSPRDANPFDLRLYRVRWPALLHNCSISTQTVVGVGVRFGDTKTGEVDVAIETKGDFSESVLPSALRARPVDLTGSPGDLYVFNSEFVHATPSVRGVRERIVLGATLGYSQGTRHVDVWS